MEKNATYMMNEAAVKTGTEVYRQVMEETKSPMEVQKTLLLKLLDDNKQTEYGRKHGFADIHSIEEYQRRVPVITYDDIATDMDRMMQGEKEVLTAYSFDHMNETSGTIGAMKVIPLTQPQMQAFVKYNRQYTDGLMGTLLECDRWMNLRSFCTSEGNHRTLPSGISVGCASSKMVDFIGGPEKADRFMRTLYTSPIEASAPKPGVDAKYLHARFFLEEKNVGGIVSGFFSLVALYLKYIADNYEMLIDDIENGTINPSISMPPEVRDSVQTKLFPNPVRAAELREVFKEGSDIPFIPMVWPRMYYIAGVGADGFSSFDRTISERYGGGHLKRIYSGITASEGLFSIPSGIDNPDSILAPGAGFMEFLPVEAGDDFSKAVTMDRLEEGKIYEIICTNLAGLYRYRMSDAVLCTGRFNETPLVQFMYRVNRTINLVCEKTTEKALDATVEKTASDLGLKLAAYSVFPNGDTFPVRYEFLLEPDGQVPTGADTDSIAQSLNENLCHFNAEYEDCMVADKTIGTPLVHWVMPGTSSRFVDLMAARGKSPSQQKPVKIITNEVQRTFFYKMRVGTTGMDKEKAIRQVMAQATVLEALSDALWDRPECHFQEHFAAGTLSQCLADHGFSVERGIAGIPTAFRASYGQGSPIIGLLAEYDALPGMSQVAGAMQKQAVEAGAAGHGCGHNLIAGGTIGAALAIKAYLEAYPDRGTVVVYGCPDEEVSGAKVFMARDGLFNSLDLALCWHPADINIVPFGTTSTVFDINYTFTGESTHTAAGFAEKLNALEGAELMNMGLQFLRNRVSQEAQIDYAFADAGKDTPNVTQDTATVHYSIRSVRRKYLDGLRAKVENLAQGAALMTDTQVSGRVVGANSGYIANSLVCRQLYDNFASLGAAAYDEEDKAYAESLAKVSGYSARSLKYVIAQLEDKRLRNRLLEQTGSPLFTDVIPPTSHEVHNPASTDVGDVSRVCPVGQVNVATMPIGATAHTWQAVAVGKSGMAHKGMLRAAEVLAATAIDFFENPALADFARAEFDERTNGHPYESPIPEWLHPEV